MSFKASWQWLRQPRFVGLGLSLLTTVWVLWGWMLPGWAAPSTTPEALPKAALNAAALFTVQCAGCHPNGGNIIRRNKNLKQKALQRNGLDSVEKITELITEGKGNMSAYGDRLTPEEIRSLAQYVWETAPRW